MVSYMSNMQGGRRRRSKRRNGSGKGGRTGSRMELGSTNNLGAGFGLDIGGKGKHDLGLGGGRNKGILDTGSRNNLELGGGRQRLSEQVHGRSSLIAPGVDKQRRNTVDPRNPIVGTHQTLDDV